MEMPRAQNSQNNFRKYPSGYLTPNSKSLQVVNIKTTWNWYKEKQINETEQRVQIQMKKQLISDKSMEKQQAT